MPRLALYLDAEDCLPFKRRALVIVFVLADLITVTAQLAGTALTITFGDLVSIGQKVSNADVWQSSYQSDFNTTPPQLATAGLWVQLACFTCFVGIYVVFGMRLYV